MNPAAARFCRGCGGPLSGAPPPAAPEADAWNGLPLPTREPNLPVLPIALAALGIISGGILWALRPMPVAHAQSPPIAVVHPTPAPPAWVGAVTLCHDLDTDFGPVTPLTRFHPADALHCSVTLTNAPAGRALEAHWYFGTTPLKVSRHILERAQPHGHVAFSLSAPQPWPAGDYHVDVLADDAPVKTLPFQVAP